MTAKELRTRFETLLPKGGAILPANDRAAATIMLLGDVIDYLERVEQGDAQWAGKPALVLMRESRRR